MFSLIKEYRREFVYSSYLFLIFELLVTPNISTNLTIFGLVALVGYVLINSWLISTYKIFGSKKVSKYSEVLIKVSLIDRLFTYVLIPLLFYTAIVLLLFLSLNMLFNQIIIVTCVGLFFYLFLYVRTSYERMYYVFKLTRVVIDFISIVLFFLLSTVLNQIIFDNLYYFASILGLSVFSFIYILFHHNKLEISSAVLALVTGLFIASFTLFVDLDGMFALPALISILYYLVVSLWNVRFSGSNSLSDYMPPLMFSIMAIILVLSF